MTPPEGLACIALSSYALGLRFRLRLSNIRATTPTTKPITIDSAGKPGTPPGDAVAVAVVVVVVELVRVDMKVEVADVTIAVVEVETVETTV